MMQLCWPLRLSSVTRPRGAECDYALRCNSHIQPNKSPSAGETRNLETLVILKVSKVSFSTGLHRAVWGERGSEAMAGDGCVIAATRSLFLPCYTVHGVRNVSIMILKPSQEDFKVEHWL
jgi:hypothetical protein